jgi:hypothetical protein
MSDDLESIAARGISQPATADQNARRIKAETALLGVIALCLVVLVGIGFGILHEERRQSCAMRWTFPMLQTPNASPEAKGAFLVATNQCFGVTP